MLKRFFLAATFLIFCTPSLVDACTCMLEAGGCSQSWKSGQVIFVGAVTGKLTETTPNTRGFFTRNAFQFSVSESFRGPAIAGQDITVYTGVGGGDCGYEFKIGMHYLVYASLSNGKLVTSICTPTTPAGQTLHIIRELRAIQKGERVPDLFGMVGTSPLTLEDDPREIKPLTGKRVRVIGSNNFEQSTTTDNEGIYSFQSLPADAYRIEIDPPSGMSTWQRNKGESYKVEIGTQGRNGCPASLTFSADGRIKGRVVDEEGNGLAGFVTLEFIDPKEAEIAKWRGGGMGYTTENGEFELWLLRPSRYRLVFRPKIGGQVRFNVPAAKSEVITVGLGQHIENYQFKVPTVRP